MGLLLPGERQSVEPMASVVAPARVAAEHQSLLHLVGQGPWSDEAVLRKVRALVLPSLERLAPIEAWIVDAPRRAKAKVPPDVVFQTKPEIALDQITAAREAGVAPGVVLADAAYGCNGAFRAGITALGLSYAVAVRSNATVWPPSMEPLPAEPWGGRGRPTSRLRRSGDHAPLSVKDLALGLLPETWTSRTWREGTNAALSSHFCALRCIPRRGTSSAPPSIPSNGS